jgi:broad specificity phosphatase PhoE
MDKLCKIYIVRHAESFFNASHNIEEYPKEGPLGYPLSEKGREQAKALVKKLNSIKFSAVFSSDLSRAKETAEIIALEKKLVHKMRNTIRERSVFDYLNVNKKLTKKGLLKLEEEIRENLAKLDEKAKMEYKHSSRYESAREGALRLLTLLKEIAVGYRGKTVLVVSHGNIMRSLLTHLGWAKYDELPSSTIENTGFFVLETDGVNFLIKETVGIHKIAGKRRGY